MCNPRTLLNHTWHTINTAWTNPVWTLTEDWSRRSANVFLSPRRLCTHCVGCTCFQASAHNRWLTQHKPSLQLSSFQQQQILHPNLYMSASLYENPVTFSPGNQDLKWDFEVVLSSGKNWHFGNTSWFLIPVILCLLDAVLCKKK